MIADVEARGTLTFSQALLQAEAQARSTLAPELHERLSCAVALVQEGKVLQSDDRATWLVESRSHPGTQHRVNGTCPCQDACLQAPQGLCAHRLGVYLARRTLQLMQTPPPVVEEAPMDEVPEVDAPLDGAPGQATPELPAGIHPRHIVWIQGRPFIKFAGLLEAAHARGLQSLKVEWTFNDAELSLAHAVAVFPFGIFEDSGDATPTNTNKKVAPHFRRCALTRASARALRLALGIDLVAEEELAA